MASVFLFHETIFYYREAQALSCILCLANKSLVRADNSDTDHSRWPIWPTEHLAHDHLTRWTLDPYDPLPLLGQVHALSSTKRQLCDHSYNDAQSGCQLDTRNIVIFKAVSLFVYSKLCNVLVSNYLPYILILSPIHSYTVECRSSEQLYTFLIFLYLIGLAQILS